MTVSVLTGDCLDLMRGMPAGSVQTCVTSPPYFGLRSYGMGADAGEIGLEPTPDAYVARLVEVFREVRRILRRDGTLWLNLGDSYSGAKPGAPGRGLERDGWDRAVTDARRHVGPQAGFKLKDRMMIPARVALALQADGWWLRDEIVWFKPNAMPSSVTDRTTPAHEMVYMLTRSARYFYDHEAIKVPASLSFANDPRHLTGSTDANAKDGYEAAGAQNPKGPHRLFRSSGNKARKSRDGALGERGQGPATSVPWEGTMANRRSVWTIPTQPTREAHFATFPEQLARDCILAGCPQGGLVLDPFAGSGTVGLVAAKLSRRAVLCELNPVNVEIIHRRVEGAGLFAWKGAAE